LRDFFNRRASSNGALGGWNVQIIEKLRDSYERKLWPLSFAARIAVIVLACVLVGGLIFWLCNELVYFYMARSYSEELADYYDLNRGFTRALLWASFATIVILAGYSLSFSKWKRRLGYTGLLMLLIGHSLLLGRMDTNFQKSGAAEKCYVITRTSIRLLNRVGIDSETGLECRPLTPQMAEKIKLYQAGYRAKQIASNDPTFFDPTTGEPVVWYSKNDRGQIELFDLMGYHPQTGEELIPVTRDVVQAWKQQSAKVVRRVPVRVNDPETLASSNQRRGQRRFGTGKAKVESTSFTTDLGFTPRRAIRSRS
jgi:hypothetical protein